ncbi:hypothetical protein Tco_1483834, partial [Tanacetum coccineum]
MLKDGERMWRSIEKGPYERPLITDPDDDKVQILEPLSKMIESNKKQYIADVKVMNYLLQAIPNGIYNLVDACKNAKEMWEQIKRLMFGYDVTNHVRHSRLDEFEKFAAKERESLKSMYDILTTLVNIMDHNNVRPIPVSINTKFLNCLQPEWSKYVTMDGRVDIQTKNAGCGGNGNKNVGRQNMNQSFNVGNGNYESHYAHNYPKPRVHHAKYFREQMLLAMKEESGSNLNDEEKDFMLDNSFEDDTLEELTVVVIMMARIQPADENGVQKPNYDAKAVSELAKKAFKEQEDRYLEDIVDLEEKLSSHDRIVYKMGQSIQTIHMLGKTPNQVYDPFLKAGLGYKNPERLKKAIAAQLKMYHGEKFYSTKLKIDSPDFEETLEAAEERVGSSNSVRRPKFKDTKSKNRVLKNTNAKSSYAYVRKTPSSVRLDSNKHETKHSNECQSNASVLNTKTVTDVNDGLNLVCVSYGKNVFLLSHEKCVARYALSVDSRVKRALFTTSVLAKSRNLGATSVVAKYRFSVAKTPTTTNKVSSASSLSPDSKKSDPARPLDYGMNEIPSQQDLDNLLGPLNEEYYAPSTFEVSNNSAGNTLDVEEKSCRRTYYNHTVEDDLEVFSTEDPGLDWISAHNFLTRLQMLSSYASGHLEVSKLAAYLEKASFSSTYGHVK